MLHSLSDGHRGSTVRRGKRRGQPAGRFRSTFTAACLLPVGANHPAHLEIADPVAAHAGIMAEIDIKGHTTSEGRNQLSLLDNVLRLTVYRLRSSDGSSSSVCPGKDLGKRTLFQTQIPVGEPR